MALTGTGSLRIKLWDLPVRLVHWSFVALLPVLWWSAEEGKIDLHKSLGLIMLGLVTFRILWGLFGSSTARFSGFVRGPAAIRAYLRGLKSGDVQPIAGHNPLGALSVVAILGLLAFQAGIGLITQDVDGVESGPLNYLVSYDTADKAREVHELGFDLILLVIALHIAAILFYTFVKKDRLVPPMITGSKDMPATVAPPRMAPLWRAIPAILFAAAFAWWLGKGAPTSLQQLTAPPPASAEEYM